MERGEIMKILEAQHLYFSVHQQPLMQNVSLQVEAGEFCAIIGPNGAGKTTLLNLMNGDLKAQSGEVTLLNQPLAHIDLLQLSRMRAVLPQLIHIPFAIKVLDIVNLGREPYRYMVDKATHQEIILDCMQKMGVAHLQDQYYATLSGGEQHRVHLARTLAQLYQQPQSDLAGKILFLDEPTNHLDIHHQYQLMQLLKTLQQQGLTIIAVMHDLALTLQFAEHIVLLEKGKKVGDYGRDELAQSGDLSKVYQMPMHIIWSDKYRRYLVIPEA